MRLELKDDPRGARPLLSAPPTLVSGLVLLFLYLRRGVLEEPRALLTAVLVGLAAMMVYLALVARGLGASLVRTIEDLRHGAESTATVNPDHRLEVRTGDESESVAPGDQPSGGSASARPRRTGRALGGRDPGPPDGALPPHRGPRRPPRWRGAGRAGRANHTRQSDRAPSLSHCKRAPGGTGFGFRRPRLARSIARGTGFERGEPGTIDRRDGHRPDAPRDPHADPGAGERDRLRARVQQSAPGTIERSRGARGPKVPRTRPGAISARRRRVALRHRRPRPFVLVPLISTISPPPHEVERQIGPGGRERRLDCSPSWCWIPRPPACVPRPETAWGCSPAACA